MGNLSIKQVNELRITGRQDMKSQPFEDLYIAKLMANKGKGPYHPYEVEFSNGHVIRVSAKLANTYRSKPRVKEVREVAMV